MRVFLRFGIPDLGGRDSFDGEIRCRGRPMSQPHDDRQDDRFRPPLEEIINLRHPLVRLAGALVVNPRTGRAIDDVTLRLRFPEELCQAKARAPRAAPRPPAG